MTYADRIAAETTMSAKRQAIRHDVSKNHARLCRYAIRSTSPAESRRQQRWER